jgi:hypothetical protein
MLRRLGPCVAVYGDATRRLLLRRQTSGTGDALPEEGALRLEPRQRGGAVAGQELFTCTLLERPQGLRRGVDHPLVQPRLGRAVDEIPHVGARQHGRRGGTQVALLPEL